MNASELNKLLKKHGLTTSDDQEFASVSTVCRKYDLGRTTIFEGIKNGWFDSVLIRKPGRTSGRRLICLASFRRWLTSQMKPSN